MRADLRFLIHEGGWTYRGLNAALGFPPTSTMLRSIAYDKTNKASTTRARFDALRRIRDEGLAPGVVLVEAAPPKPGTSGAKNAPNKSERGGSGSGRSRRATQKADSQTDGDAETPIAVAPAGDDTGPDAPAAVLTFAMNGTEFSARQQADGQWRVTLSATCSTAQMMAWNQQILSDQLAAATTTPDSPVAPVEADEADE